LAEQAGEAKVDTWHRDDEEGGPGGPRSSE
jgi:hypothetical protein